MRNLIILITLLVGSATASATEDYWVWVDKDGVTNYSEQQPVGVEGARHIVNAAQFGQSRDDNNAPAGDQASTDNSTTETSATQDNSAAGPVDPDAAIADQRAAIEARIAQTRMKNCEVGKRNLAQLEAYAHIRVKGDDGKERELTDEEHQAKIEEAKQIIRQNCTN